MFGRDGIFQLERIGIADDGMRELEVLAQYKLEAQLPLLPCDQEHPGGRERLLVKNFVIPARYSWEGAWEDSEDT